MTIRAIIWDLGGVILRTEDRTPRLRLARRFGMTYDELDRLVFESQSSQLATVGLIDETGHWESVSKTLNIPGEEISTFQASFFDGDRIDTKLLDTIRSFRPRYRTGLLSNAWSDLRKYIENKWNISEVFDDIIISAEVGLAKPDQRIYQLAIDRLGVTAEEAVFIDDVLGNVEGARAAGLSAIKFLNPPQVQEDLEKLLDHE